MNCIHSGLAPIGLGQVTDMPVQAARVLPAKKIQLAQKHIRQISKLPRVKNRGIARPASSENFIYWCKPIELRSIIKIVLLERVW